MFESKKCRYILSGKSQFNQGCEIYTNSELKSLLNEVKNS